jgi:hypothetical protein
MTVSSSTNFSLSASDVIVAARRKLGIQAQEETLEAADLTDGLTTLNMMLKAWQADGVMCWTFSEVTFVLAQADTTVTFGAGMDVTTIPFEIVSMNINRGSNDIPMIPLSRQDYRRLPNKTSQGYPTQYFYQRDRSGGTLYIWPAADASGGTLYIDTRRIVMDMDASANTFDFPQEWYEALVYGLADRLAEDYGMVGTPEGQQVASKAAMAYAIVKDNDVGMGRIPSSSCPTGWTSKWARRRAALRHAGRAVQLPAEQPGTSRETLLNMFVEVETDARRRVIRRQRAALEI